jgi:cytochrome b6-f complex iron-sulfur subunit
MRQAAETSTSSASAPERRTFLSIASSVAMAAGLLSGYGTLCYIAGRFLYSAYPRKLAWLFVAEAAKVKIGEVLRFQTPAGQMVTITRRDETGTEADFVALSSTCPHLGCQVHWEPQNNRFFCPCHNGAFEPSGKAIAGPPAEAGQSLPKFPLRMENELIFVQAPVEVLG